MKTKDKNISGINRTGIKTSPLLIRKMLDNTEEFLNRNKGSSQAIAENRIRFMETGDHVGSIPIPTTLKGIAKTSLQTVQGHDPLLLLNKLSERAAFEQTGVRLYDALISKFEVSGIDQNIVSLGELNKIRNDELKHFHLVCDTIENMGADPTCMTPAADIVAVASLGIQKVMVDPRIGFIDSLEAILIAELADHDCWNLLIDLTQEAGLKDVVASFQEALQDEQEHLRLVRYWIKQLRLNAPAQKQHVA